MSDSLKHVLLTVGVVTVGVIGYKMYKKNKNKAIALVADIVVGDKAVIADKAKAADSSAILAAATAKAEADAAVDFKSKVSAAKIAIAADPKLSTASNANATILSKVLPVTEYKDVSDTVNLFVPKVVAKATAAGTTGPALGGAALGAANDLCFRYLSERILGKTHSASMMTINTFSQNFK